MTQFVLLENLPELCKENTQRVVHRLPWSFNDSGKVAFYFHIDVVIRHQVHGNKKALSIQEGLCRSDSLC